MHIHAGNHKKLKVIKLDSNNIVFKIPKANFLNGDAVNVFSYSP